MGGFPPCEKYIMRHYLLSVGNNKVKCNSQFEHLDRLV